MALYVSVLRSQSPPSIVSQGLSAPGSGCHCYMTPALKLEDRGEGFFHGDRACGTNSGITRVWSPYSPVTGGSTPSSHHHQAQQPQGGLWRLGGGPSADPGPGRPPTPVAGAAGPRSKCRGLHTATRGGAGTSRGQAALPGPRSACTYWGRVWGLRSQKTAVLPCDSLKVAGRTDAGL